MPRIQIGDRVIGPYEPTYIVAELSANHLGDFDRAVALIRAAADAGADAVKLQTYTADTLTLDSDQEWFRIGGDGPWAGRNLHELYREAAMPWDWYPRLRSTAEDFGLHLFSTPFDETAVTFLQRMKVPAFKIASFELTDLPLLKAVAATGKPIILSTGMATTDEIAEAVVTLRQAGVAELALLKCTSAYPSPVEEMNLRGVPYLAGRFNVVSGLSDHTLSEVPAIAATVLGGRILEKHFTLARADGGPDAAFSMEPSEFACMVAAIREVERALGDAAFGESPHEQDMRALRRSLFVIEDVRAGQPFTTGNVRSIRPADGLHPRHFDEVLGKTAAVDIARGTPLSWDLIAP